MSLAAFRDYLLLEKNYSAHTVRAYTRDIQNFTEFINTDFETDQVVTADYSMIRSWIVELVAAGLSNRTVNRKVASLTAYYKFLVKTEQIASSPLTRHKSLKSSTKVELPFSEQEMIGILEQIEYPDTFEGIRDKLIIELLYTTGIRRSELINLRLGDIDPGISAMKVLGKRNKERIIPLLPGTLDLYHEYLYARDTLLKGKKVPYLILTKSGLKIYETLVYRIINGYFSMVSTKVKKSPHILRHTFATHLLNKGADMNSVKELLGHSSLASTQVYTHNSIAELKKVHATAHPRSKD